MQKKQIFYLLCCDSVSRQFHQSPFWIFVDVCLSTGIQLGFDSSMAFFALCSSLLCFWILFFFFNCHHFNSMHESNQKNQTKKEYCAVHLCNGRQWRRRRQRMKPKVRCIFEFPLRNGRNRHKDTKEKSESVASPTILLDETMFFGCVSFPPSSFLFGWCRRWILCFIRFPLIFLFFF